MNNQKVAPRAIASCVIALAVVMGIGSTAVQTQTGRGEIAVVGQFLGDGPWARVTGQWLLLTEQRGGWELREVEVRSRQVPAVCGDLAFAVEAGDATRGSLLIRGFSSLQPRRLTAGFSGTKFLLPGESLELSIGDDGWSLHAFGTARPALQAGIGEPQFTNYDVQLVGRGRIASVFFREWLDTDAPPRILWVGDLDGDGVPDIFADIPEHYAGHRYTLFFSSAAQADGFVAEAASLRTSGC
jgi:hypothetical protein